MGARLNILLGVTGGIAAYKAPLLLRELMRRGCAVKVVMTESATRFVGPITFTGLTGSPPVVDLWDPNYEGEVHVALAEWADVMVIAPATANTMARAAHGHADDALTATILCFDGPTVFAPAMHHRMWLSAATAANVARLREDGALMVGPVDGPLASGESGMGRMAEPSDIADAVIAASPARDLEGVSLVVTAGGTQEDIDPVRYIGNRSTGKMGYAVAARALARGADVTLISGPTSLEVPAGAEHVEVRSAIEMQGAVEAARPKADVIVMAAAVADYRPAEPLEQKMKKSAGPKSLDLVRNPDILATLGGSRRGSRPMLVGFAVETTDLVAAARKKLEKKGADLIVANLAAASFGRDDNEVTLVDAESEEALPVLSKRDVADRILDRVAASLAE